MRAVIVGALLVLGASPSRAQIGHPPSQSPYRDVPSRQELTAMAGWFGGNAGSAGVGPQAGPALGVRWDFRIGGPVSLTARVLGIATERRIIDPEREPEERVLGTERFPMLITDVGLTLALTGRKSWNYIVPVVTGSVGMASDLGKDIDVGGFGVGTPLALSLGAGLRYVPRRNWQLRLDVTDYLYRMRYPSAYFTAPSEDSEPVLPAGASRSEWQHNATFMLGVSYLFGR